MGIDRPEASSTPTAVPYVQGRTSVRNYKSIASPIPHGEMDDQIDYLNYLQHPEHTSDGSPLRNRVRKRNSPYNDTNDDYCESEFDSSDEDSLQVSNSTSSLNQSDLQLQENSVQMKTESYEKNTNIYVGITFGVVLLLIIIGLMCKLSEDDSGPNRTTREKLINTFEHMAGQFVHQEEDFWRKIRLNIEEIQCMHKPSIIIFMYENSYNGKSTMRRILNEVKSVAVCHLTDCGKDPIEIQGSSLNAVEIIADHGKIISQYRDPLETSGVMIVEHLEDVPGKAAQAFHHFCDEYNPLVRKALLLFTIKVDKLPEDEKSDAYLRKTLEVLWSDIGKDDKFEPLYARISGTILIVRSE